MTGTFGIAPTPGSVLNPTAQQVFVLAPGAAGTVQYGVLDADGRRIGQARISMMAGNPPAMVCRASPADGASSWEGA